jgi:protein-disulfide isomerase
VHAAFLPLVFLAGVGLGYLIWDRPAAKNQPAGASPTQTAQVGQAKRYTIPIDGEPSLGPDDAPVTLVMFSDYQCPYCRQWYQEVFKPLESAYPNKIRFVYKDFPLSSLHEFAAPAAEAAHCAGDQGKYWEYQAKLFSGELALGTQTFTKYASDLSLDDKKFADCLSSRKFEKHVSDDYTFAANLGVQSTPTFFVNGLAVIGAQPLEVFKQMIDQELAANN